MIIIVGLLVAAIVLVPRERKSPPKERTATAVEPHSRPLNLRGFNALLLLQELDITDQQDQTLRSLADAFLAEVKRIVDRGKRLQELSESEKAQQWQEMDIERQRTIDDFSQQAVAVLMDEQQFRLSQIAFQLRGEEVFYDKDVVSELKLTSQQRRAIAAARNSLRQQAQQFNAELAARQLSRVQYSERIAALRREQLDKYEKILSEQQSANYQVLRGQSIPFTKDDVAWELRPRSTQAEQRRVRDAD
ncbi:MAG TPA: hypothetical protein VMP01_06560 [Pirellulaceae bacterium]|nr:hypothetical protein [Pirellulaceae bacterium]